MKTNQRLERNLLLFWLLMLELLRRLRSTPKKKESRSSMPKSSIIYSINSKNTLRHARRKELILVVKMPFSHARLRSSLMLYSTDPIQSSSVLTSKVESLRWARLFASLTKIISR